MNIPTAKFTVIFGVKLRKDFTSLCRLKILSIAKAQYLAFDYTFVNSTNIHALTMTPVILGSNLQETAHYRLGLP